MHEANRGTGALGEAARFWSNEGCNLLIFLHLCYVQFEIISACYNVILFVFSCDICLPFSLAHPLGHSFDQTGALPGSWGPAEANRREGLCHSRVHSVLLRRLFASLQWSATPLRRKVCFPSVRLSLWVVLSQKCSQTEPSKSEGCVDPQNIEMSHFYYRLDYSIQKMLWTWAILQVRHLARLLLSLSNTLVWGEKLISHQFTWHVCSLGPAWQPVQSNQSNADIFTPNLRHTDCKNSVTFSDHFSWK